MNFAHAQFRLWQHWGRRPLWLSIKQSRVFPPFFSNEHGIWSQILLTACSWISILVYSSKLYHQWGVNSLTLSFRCTVWWSIVAYVSLLWQRHLKSHENWIVLTCAWWTLWNSPLSCGKLGTYIGTREILVLGYIAGKVFATNYDKHVP